MLPPRGPADEHQLAGKRASLRERHAAHHRPWREQDLTQTPVPKGRVSARQKHHPDYSVRLLLCEFHCHYNIPSQFLVLFCQNRTVTK